MAVGTTTSIIYPETDGMPLPDGEYQAPIYRKAVTPLEVRYSARDDVRVNGDTFIYYVEGNPRRNVAPDCYVVFGLTEGDRESIRRNNTYLVWEIGKAPDFVMEIASKSTARTDLGSKREIYASIGVKEYWRYDQTGGDFYGEPLVGERLVDGQYVEIDVREESDGRLWSHSEILNLDLCWDEGELRYWDPDEVRWLLTHEEEHEARLEAEAQGQHERNSRIAAEAWATSERDVRIQAEARIAELEAELKRRNG